MENRLVTMADFARLKGVSRKTVTVWVQKGRVPTHVVGARVLIDPVEAERALQNSVQRIVAVEAALDATSTEEQEEVGTLPETDSVGRVESLTQLKSATERERGRLLELNRLEREGALVDREQVEAEQEAAARLVRQTLDQLPSHAEDLGAAYQRGGVPGLRAALKALVRNTEEVLSRSLVEAAERIEFERSEGDAEFAA